MRCLLNPGDCAPDHLAEGRLDASSPRPAALYRSIRKGRSAHGVFKRPKVSSRGFGPPHERGGADGPGSLLNFQGHPAGRLTPNQGVTYPSDDAIGLIPGLPSGKRRVTVRV